MSEPAAVKSSGKFDPLARRRALRHGRESGCWVYIAGELLGTAGYVQGEPPPFYRVWAGERGRFVVTTYREA